MNIFEKRFSLDDVYAVLACEINAARQHKNEFIALNGVGDRAALRSFDDAIAAYGKLYWIFKDYKGATK